MNLCRETNRRFTAARGLHHNTGEGRDGITVWIGGEGVLGTVVHSATDNFGYYATEKRMSGYDLHATLLDLLGIEHTRLTNCHNRQGFRLTVVHGNVATDILV